MEEEESDVSACSEARLEQVSRALALYPALLTTPHDDRTLQQLAAALGESPRRAAAALHTFTLHYRRMTRRRHPRPRWWQRVHRAQHETPLGQWVMRAARNQCRPPPAPMPRAPHAVRELLELLAAEGGAPDRLAPAVRPTTLEAPLLALVALYDERLRALPPPVFERVEGRRLMSALLVAARRAGAEGRAPEWRAYGGAVAARQWHALKEEARGAVRRYARGGAAPARELLAVVEAFPHVATQPLATWRALEGAGALAHLQRDLAEDVDESRPMTYAAQSHACVCADHKLSMRPVVELEPMQVDAAVTLRDRIKFEPSDEPGEEPAEGVEPLPAPSSWYVSARELRGLLERARSCPPAPEPPPCCAARRQRNEAEKNGWPVKMPCTGCGAQCTCCCAVLLAGGAGLHLAMVVRRVRGLLRTPPAPRPTSPKPAPSPPLDPLTEWNRQKTLTARYFDLNLGPRKSKPVPLPVAGTKRAILEAAATSPRTGVPGNPVPILSIRVVAPGDLAPRRRSPAVPDSDPPAPVESSGSAALTSPLAPLSAPPEKHDLKSSTLLELLQREGPPPRCSGRREEARDEYCALPLPAPVREEAPLSAEEWCALRVQARPCVVYSEEGEGWGPCARYMLVTESPPPLDTAGWRMVSAGDSAVGVRAVREAPAGARSLRAVRCCGSARRAVCAAAAGEGGGVWALCRASGALLPLVSQRAAPHLVTLRCADPQFAQELANALNADRP